MPTFWATVCKTVCPMLSIRCLSVLSVLSVCLSVCSCLWRSCTVAKWLDGSTGHYVLDGDPALPPPKGGGAPQFSAHICCSQTAGWLTMPLGIEVGLSPCNFVFDGDPALPSLKMWAEPPSQFSAHFFCSQTAAIPLHASRCLLVRR